MAKSNAGTKTERNAKYFLNCDIVSKDDLDTPIIRVPSGIAILDKPGVHKAICDQLEAAEKAGTLDEQVIYLRATVRSATPQERNIEVSIFS